MAWVYRYIDLADDIIKYVGVVWGKSRTLAQRLREHEKNDKWCYTRRWRIEYITNDIETRAEAEAFETHYIALYDTGKYFNIRQVGYGTNKFLPDRENDWIEFDIDKVLKEDKENTYKQISELNIRLQNLKANISDKEKEFARLKQMISDLAGDRSYLIDIIASERESVKNNDETLNDYKFIIYASCNHFRVEYGSIKSFNSNPNWRRITYADGNAIRTKAYNELDCDKQARYFYISWGNTIEDAYRNLCEATTEDMIRYHRWIDDIRNGVCEFSDYDKRRYGTREIRDVMETDKYTDNIKILKTLEKDAAIYIREHNYQV